MATLSRTDYPTTNQGGVVVFDGTDIWTARQGTTSAAAGDTVFLTQADPTTGTVLNSFAAVGVGDAITPGDMVFLAGSIWFIEADQFVDQIDPLTGAMLNQFVIGTSPAINGVIGRSIGTDGSSLFIQLFYLDALLNQQSAMIRMETDGTITWGPTNYSATNDGFDCIVTAGRVWTVSRFGGNLFSLNPITGAVIDTVHIAGAILGKIAAGPGAGIITLIDFNGNLYQVDTATLAISGPFPIPASRFPYNLVFDPAGNIWIEDQDTGTNQFFFDVFNPISTVIATLGTDFGRTGTGLAFEGISGRVWASTYDPVLNPQLTALLLSGGSSGRFIGSFVGIFAAGQFGGGTK